MPYIVIETCSNTSDKPPFSRVQCFANGSARTHANSKDAAKEAQSALHQPNNGVASVLVQFIPAPNV